MKKFGILKNGTTASKYIIENDKIRLVLTDFGAAIVSIILKTPQGEIDVALGYDNAADYEKNSGYLGASVGRVANRIENSKFELDGKTYNLSQNDGKHHLHGGKGGFSYKIFSARANDNSVTFSYVSPDGEEGYPGSLKTDITYKLNSAAVEISYLVKTDTKTAVSLTNHTYFNLNGHDSGDILGHTLMIDADRVTPTDNELIACGQFLDVSSTPFDFRQPKKIGERIFENQPMLNAAEGYDINYAVNGKCFRRMATVSAEKTGISMYVDSDADGLQLYCGNKLSANGKDGAVYKKYGGLCLETQSFPNAVNHTKEYGFSFLEVGQVYKTKTVYGFTWKD